MKPVVVIATVLGLYAAGVFFRDYFVRHHTVVSRAFFPPTFTFSRSYYDGIVRPFKIGMQIHEVEKLASGAKLVREDCHPAVEMPSIPGPAYRCYLDSRTGIHWDMWVRRGRLVALRVFTPTSGEL